MKIQRIAFCTDFSDNADAAFGTAWDMAGKYDAQLVVLHVIPQEIHPLLPRSGRPSDKPPDSLVLDIGERLRRKYSEHGGADVNIEFAVRDGHVSTEILKFLDAENIDLVVMGSYGLTGMGLVVLGSVAKRVAHRSPCSVMIVRKQDGQGK